MILGVKYLCRTWEMNLKFYEFIYFWVLHIENERGSIIFKVWWLMGWNILEQIFRLFVLPTHCCDHRIKEVNNVPMVYTILTIKPISILLLNEPNKTQGYTIPIPTILRIFQMFWLILYRDGNGVGWAGPKDKFFALAPHGFFLPHPRPAPHDGENFLPHPRPLRPREDPRSPTLHRKTLFLVNFPYNYYHFFK